MLYEGLALWRVMLEGCGRIRDLPYEVMRKDGDKEGTFQVLCGTQRTIQSDPGRSHREDTLMSRFTEGALSSPHVRSLTTSASQNTAEN